MNRIIVIDNKYDGSRSFNCKREIMSIYELTSALKSRKPAITLFSIQRFIILSLYRKKRNKIRTRSNSRKMNQTGWNISLIKPQHVQNMFPPQCKRREPV